MIEHDSVNDVELGEEAIPHLFLENYPEKLRHYGKTTSIPRNSSGVKDAPPQKLQLEDKQALPSLKEFFYHFRFSSLGCDHSFSLCLIGDASSIPLH